MQSPERKLKNPITQKNKNSKNKEKPKDLEITRITTNENDKVEECRMQTGKSSTESYVRDLLTFYSFTYPPTQNNASKLCSWCNAWCAWCAWCVLGVLHCAYACAVHTRKHQVAPVRLAIWQSAPTPLKKIKKQESINIKITIKLWWVNVFSINGFCAFQLRYFQSIYSLLQWFNLYFSFFNSCYFLP